MAKPELGTKRICPETGRKFYDLNKDPIVSPYTGQSYPRSYFDAGNEGAIDNEEDVEDRETDDEDEDTEIISLEDADDEAKGDEQTLPDLDDDDVDLGDDDDDTFLEDDEEDEDDDVKDIIGGVDEDDEH
ncbi:uncharacterized protein (TIGR02300 family) [Mesorhizobium sp. J18]|uniref:TIGR02300 family protein n=1 Tax=Mesorhizobium sp. J18 TaxID=935263 RepID=UPI00119A28D1|nr:TIGR02300 family protein [Mesorhizobium sp. J18]TWG92452.1 uncharacterized protein (TIGR02300 family) [Mesorhizobium sp. J18]